MGGLPRPYEGSWNRAYLGPVERFGRSQKENEAKKKRAVESSRVEREDEEHAAEPN